MRKLDPRKPEELQKMLDRGMGRAVIYLMSQDLSQYRQLILNSCLHNHAYDRQVEETRARYLFPLIKASREEEYYRDEILRALLKENNSYDAEQFLDFALLFAQDGDEKAREAIYEKVKWNDTDSTLVGEDQIIELDGIDGLVFLLDLIGSDPELMEHYKDDFIIRNTEKKSSVGKVRLALRKATRERPNVARALANMEYYSPDLKVKEILQKRKENRDSHFRHNAHLSADTAWEEVKNSPDFNRLVYRWSGLALDAEIEKAARDLDPNEEPERLRYHLRIFDSRPFPLNPAPVISLVEHPSEKVVIRALSALEIVEHPDVRDLFYRLIENPEWSDRAIGLLRANYKSGDHSIITDLLEREDDPDRIHLMCIQVMDVYEDNLVPEGLEPLLTVYEKDPCSVCRCTCMLGLRELNLVPQWMVDECIYDGYSRTREAAEELKRD